jgi:hypothetical protein
MSMTILEFVEKVTAHLAWPIVAVFAVLFFRRPLSKLVDGLNRIKHGDTEISFAHDVKALVDDAKDLEVTVLMPQTRVFEEPINIQLMALQSWAMIELILEEWFKTRSIEFAASTKEIKFPSNLRSKIEFLNDYEIINPSLYRLLLKFRDLRNRAAHSENYEVSSDEARELTGLAQSLDQRLRSFLSNFDESGRKIYEII